MKYPWLGILASPLPNCKTPSMWLRSQEYITDTNNSAFNPQMSIEHLLSAKHYSKYSSEPEPKSVPSGLWGVDNRIIIQNVTLEAGKCLKKIKHSNEIE